MAHFFPLFFNFYHLIFFSLNFFTSPSNKIAFYTASFYSGDLHSVPFKCIVGAKMYEKTPATFQIFWIPPSAESDLQGVLKRSKWSVPAGHVEAVLLCDAIDCLIHGLPPASTKSDISTKQKKKKKVSINHLLTVYLSVFIKLPFIGNMNGNFVAFKFSTTTRRHSL